MVSALWRSTAVLSSPHIAVGMPGLEASSAAGLVGYSRSKIKTVIDHAVSASMVTSCYEREADGYGYSLIRILSYTCTDGSLNPLN